MITASLLLVARRTAAHIRLLSAVVVGVVLAVTVMASSTIYFDSLRNLALTRTLNDQAPADLDVEVEAGAIPITPENRDKIINAMDTTIVSRMKPYTDNEYHAYKTWTFLLDAPPIQVLPGECPCRAASAPNQPGDDFEAGTIACDCRRLSFMTVPDLQNNIKIDEGRMPSPSTTLPTGDDPYVVEVALDKSTAELFDLSVGSEIKGKIFWNDVNESVTARLVGIYERNDPNSPMWRIYDDSFAVSGVALEFARFVVPEESIIDGLAVYFPGMGADFAWVLDVNPNKISADDTASIQSALKVTKSELSSIVDSFTMNTELGNVLHQFESHLFFNRLPMFIVLILIVLVVLYYVVTLASLLVDSQSGEVALLRSRGANSRQVLAVFVIEAGLLCTFAIVIGPFLAMGVVSAIGLMPFYADLNGGAALPVRLSLGAFELAAIGGGLSMIALFIPAIRATRLGLLTQRRSRARPPRLAFIQRYYLDLGFLALVLFLFWELSKQGSFVATDVFGQQSVDNLVLAVPALFLVSAGVVVLRVFPVIMDFMGRAMSSRIGSKIVPPSVVLGVWQMARSPSSHARLSLLLILTAGLGVFAASFATTLQRSATEQILYDTGSDLRVTNITSISGGSSYRLQDRLAGADGVVATSGVYREPSSVAQGTSNKSFTLIGAQEDTLPEVAWFRDDFSKGSLSGALNSINVGGSGGIVLPDDSFWLTALVRPLTSQSQTYLVARMSDANDRYYTLLLGTLSPQATDNARFPCDETGPNGEPGWCRVGARIAPLPVGGPALIAKAPIRLHSIGVVDFRNGASAGGIDIDDIAVLNNAEDKLSVVEEFNDLSRWRVLQPSADSLGDTLTVAVDDNEVEEPGIARFRWTSASPREMRGIAFGSEGPAMPVLASPSFMDEFGLSIGDPVTINSGPARINAVVRGTIKYFPTLNPGDKPFLIADYNAVHERLNLALLQGERQPGEMWIRTVTGDSEIANASGFKINSAGTDPVAVNVKAALMDNDISFSKILDRSSQLTGVSVDPLVSAGWQALLGIAFMTVLVVSAFGFLVHVRISFAARRGEFALLRTVGLSMSQLLVLVVLEQVIVIGVAIGIGLFMGARLGDTIIPFLANSGESSTLVPPMVLQIDWAGFGITFGLLGIVFALVIFAVLASVFRMSIHRVMRMGEG